MMITDSMVRKNNNVLCEYFCNADKAPTINNHSIILNHSNAIFFEFLDSKSSIGIDDLFMEYNGEVQQGEASAGTMG
jgi:hypothetical protein